MAKIVSSNLAPAEKVHYAFGGASFDLDEKGSFVTDDPALLAEAQVHPWLSVEYDKAEVVSGTFVERLDPKTDPLSNQHPDFKLAFDPKAVKAALVEADAEVATAIDPAEKQTKVVTDGPVNKTVAADTKATAKAEKENS